MTGVQIHREWYWHIMRVVCFSNDNVDNIRSGIMRHRHTVNGINIHLTLLACKGFIWNMVSSNYLRPNMVSSHYIIPDMVSSHFLIPNMASSHNLSPNIVSQIWYLLITQLNIELYSDTNPRYGLRYLNPHWIAKHIRYMYIGTHIQCESCLFFLGRLLWASTGMGVVSWYCYFIITEMTPNCVCIYICDSVSFGKRPEYHHQWLWCMMRALAYSIFLNGFCKS